MSRTKAMKRYLKALKRYEKDEISYKKLMKAYIATFLREGGK